MPNGRLARRHSPSPRVILETGQYVTSVAPLKIPVIRDGGYMTDSTGTLGPAAGGRGVRSPLDRVEQTKAVYSA